MSEKKITQSGLFEIVFGAEFCDRIEQVGEQYSKNCWEIGDIVTDAISMLGSIKSAIVRGDLSPWCAEYILAFGQLELYAQLGLRFGISRRTIRDYYAIANFFAAEKRADYLALPFAHFRFAKSQGDALAYKVLDLSLKAMDLNGGRPPSVEWLEVNLHRVTADHQVIDELHDIIDFDNAATSIPGTDFRVPDEPQSPLPPTVYYFMTRIKGLMVGLKDKLKNVEMDDEVRGLLDGIITLSEALADKLQEISVDKESES